MILSKKRFCPAGRTIAISTGLIAFAGLIFNMFSWIPPYQGASLKLPNGETIRVEQRAREFGGSSILLVHQSKRASEIGCVIDPDPYFVPMKAVLRLSQNTSTVIVTYGRAELIYNYSLMMMTNQHGATVIANKLD